jgi:hypothetical protein
VIILRQRHSSHLPIAKLLARKVQAAAPLLVSTKIKFYLFQQYGGYDATFRMPRFIHIMMREKVDPVIVFFFENPLTEHTED